DYSNPQSTPKAVYVFTQSGGIWFFQQKLTSPSSLPPILTYGTYGYNISISGNTLAVSGEFGMHAGPTGGTVYVYVFSGSSWVLQQTIKSPDEFSDAFGGSLALDGNRLVIGMHADVIFSAVSRGSAYVYERTGTIWNLRQKLIAADGAAEDYFGLGMALSGNTIIVGASGADISGYSHQGAAYVFTLQYGNTLPTVTPYGPYTIQEGSTAHNLPIAVVSDAETDYYSLLFDYDNTPFLKFSNVEKTGSLVRASITCDCSIYSYSGDTKAELNVVDGNSAVGVSTITISRTANTAPSIGRYPVTSIAVGGSKTVLPQVAPSDNGTFTVSASVAPSGFTGSISINQTTGAITFSNVGGVGTYTVTVTVKDNCNAITTRTFTLTVS
ncbi:MAG TPA: FG-GAP repeat protein, partial [Blastocatellia bacterium]|nr:FG-GAP repeat protein [Blastocatellia bacterium]